MKRDEILKKINDALELLAHDTYYLTRDDISSVEWRINDIKKYICDLYAIRGIHNADIG